MYGGARLRVKGDSRKEGKKQKKRKSCQKKKKTGKKRKKKGKNQVSERRGKERKNRMTTPIPIPLRLFLPFTAATATSASATATSASATAITAFENKFASRISFKSCPPLFPNFVVSSSTNSPHLSRRTVYIYISPSLSLSKNLQEWCLHVEFEFHLRYLRLFGFKTYSNK